MMVSVTWLNDLTHPFRYLNLYHKIMDQKQQIGGEGGIRTHGTDFRRHNRLAGDPVQPLQHLSVYKIHFIIKTVNNK